MFDLQGRASRAFAVMELNHKYFTIVAASIGIIWILFSGAEMILHQRYRKLISDWLSNSENNIGPTWPKAFSQILNRIFTDKYLSLRSFQRSAIVSLLSICGLTITFILIHDDGMTKLISIFDLFVLWLIINLFIDYFSLIQTRDFIELLTCSSFLGKILILVGDLILTVLIFLLGTMFISTISDEAIIIPDTISVDVSKFPVEWESGNKIEMIKKMEEAISNFRQIVAPLRNSVRIFCEAIFFNKKDSQIPITSIFFYSTFLTSFWIWLYLIGGMIIKFFYKFKSRFFKSIKFFDIQKQPLRVIGYTCIVLIIIIMLIILPVINWVS